MQTIKTAVEKYRQLIYDAEKFIWQHPETGYKEVVTSKYVEDIFRKLGRTDDRIQLRQNHHLGARAPDVDSGVKTG